jgi:hypothetical protein
MTESTADFAATTHILCCSCGMYFSAAASSENDHRNMNLASNTAPLASTRPCSGITTIRRAELTASATKLTRVNDQAVRRVLEAAGVEFIDENAGGPGVRSRERQQQ